MLTSKQAKFVASYQLTGNPTEAAKNAGYSAKNAAPQACRLMNHPDILAEIKQWKATKAKEITKESFVERAMGVFEGGEFKEEPTRVRGLELAGRALGYVSNGNDQKIAPALNMTQININTMQDQPDIWAMTRKLLGNE